MRNPEKFLIILVIILMSVYIAFYWLNENKPKSGPRVKLIFEPNEANVTKNYTYEVINTYPHDSDAFTQGLVYNEGVMYESTGLYGKSSLRKVDYKTGKIIKIENLSNRNFAEGLTIHRNKLIQLTWLENIGFVYDLSTFELIKTFNYTTEGWGITNDGKHLIMSDGTENLYYLDPETFQVVKTLTVTGINGPVINLNELEYIDDKIFANVWKTDYIVIINPLTGNVSGWINLSGLLSPEDKSASADVLNGIAYDELNDRLFVTGKKWPKLFEIKLISVKEDI